MPEATTLNVTFEPMIFVWLWGGTEMEGGIQTVKVATALVIEAAALLATTV